MKGWFRAFIISVFALAAVSLVIIQFVQTRRTFTISDNMFNVGVNNAMDEVILQLNGEVFQSPVGTATPFNYQALDSLIYEELIINGIDMHPTVGLYDGSQGSFLYSSNPDREADLEVSPYRYNFLPAGVVSANKFYIILSFPSTELYMLRNTNLYVYISLFLIIVIAVLFIISLRMVTKQRKLDQMKNEFINNMTHEIKTPISTIGLACEMLSDDSVSQDVASRRNFIGIIANENQRMRLLVETILQSAKMSNRKFNISLKTVDVNPIIANVMHSFQMTVEGRNGRIESHLDAVPSTVEADEMHLTNLIYNLVDNGIKYSTEAPHIVISTERTDKHFIIRVQDHGIGIAKADQKHIFEKFYRVSTGNVHNVKGFGIGLNYVAQVARLHQGRISVESTEGEGSTFTLSLPLI